MANLFEPISIGRLALANRLVRSATWEGLADPGGGVTPLLAAKMRELAEGGVGLIVTGHAFVSPEGRGGPGQLGVDADEGLPALANMVSVVHRAGGRIVLQLAHAGAHADVRLSGRKAMGPSPLEGRWGGVCREMCAADLEALTAAFAGAARRAQAAGFDGVQVHAAHGYLLSQFLSPDANRRMDGYGGDLVGRARLLLEVLAAVRGAVGADFPLLVKLNSEDLAPGGFSVEEMLEAAGMLAGAGVDAVELSGGRVVNPPEAHAARLARPSGEPPEPYYREAARRFKRAVDLPLILVGGIREVETAEALVDEGAADLLAMSRPLIREPGLPRRWQAGDRRPAACLSCNRCYVPIRAGLGPSCPVRESPRRSVR
jgi:2,4-dienoyl-CoA reductase-like NADH-dependent reductase (Old Yellow Enzyme family)